VGIGVGNSAAASAAGECVTMMSKPLLSEQLNKALFTPDCNRLGSLRDGLIDAACEVSGTGGRSRLALRQLMDAVTDLIVEIEWVESRQIEKGIAANDY
jgi:hypothetical protein